MSRVFTAAEIKEIASIIGEILLQVTSGKYPYSCNALINALRGISRGEFEGFGDVHYGTNFDQHPIPRGWKIAVINGVAQDIPASDFDISSMDLSEYHRKLKDSEGGFDFDRMRETAIRSGRLLGIADGERLMVEQKSIPYVLEDNHILLLGTLLEDPDGDLWYRCLYRFGDGDKAVWLWGAFGVR